MLDKARTLPADQLIYDLEDAVTPARKDEARAAVAAELAAGGQRAGVRSVRVNGVSSGLTVRDLDVLVADAGDGLDTIVIPKVSDAGQLAFVDHLLSQLELMHGRPLGAIGLEVQIEDASGVLELDGIVGVTPRLEVLTYGPGDLAAALGLPEFPIGGLHPTYPGDHWHLVHATLVLHARRHGLQAIAGPYVAVHDLEGFERLASRTQGLGFDGMWVLHPGQIEVANAVFGVSQLAFERAGDLLDAHHHATRQGRGAVLFGNEMIDEATRRQAVTILARGGVEGRSARPVPGEVPVEQRARWRHEHLGDPDRPAPESSDV